MLMNRVSRSWPTGTTWRLFGAGASKPRKRPPPAASVEQERVAVHGQVLALEREPRWLEFEPLDLVAEEVGPGLAQVRCHGAALSSVVLSVLARLEPGGGGRLREKSRVLFVE
jgi:hypothetical protein